MGKIVEFKRLTLREIRAKRKLTISACARVIGVHPSTLRRWEEGKAEPNLDQAYQLCMLYGISLDHVSW